MRAVPALLAARIVGATMMWGLSGKLKKKYNVEGNVRDNLYKVPPLVIFLTSQGS